MNTLSRPGLLFLAVFMAILCDCSMLRAGSTIPLIPVNRKTITVVINGEEKEYYVLGKNSPLTVEVDGPGKLTVLDRLGLTDRNVSSQEYSIDVMEGKNTLKIHTTQTDRSDASFKNSILIPGKSRKFSIEVPEGSHTYNFLLENTSAGE